MFQALKTNSRSTVGSAISGRIWVSRLILEDFGIYITPGVPRTAPRRPQGTYGLVTIDLDRPNRAWQLPGPKTSRGSTKIHSNPGFPSYRVIREILKDFLKILICGRHVFLSNHIQPPCACDPTCGIASKHAY